MSNGDKARSIPAVMTGMLERATRKWTRQRKAEERHPAARRYRETRLTAIPRTTQKEIAEEVMEECYWHVSGPRNLPAQARQIYYAARGKIMEATDNRELNYGYFSQTLLPNYQEDYPEICSDWNVIYDARGHCEEQGLKAKIHTILTKHPDLRWDEAVWIACSIRISSITCARRGQRPAASPATSAMKRRTNDRSSIQNS